MKVIIIMTIILLFTSFTETFKTLKIAHWSLKKLTKQNSVKIEL